MQALKATTGEVVWEQAINMDALNQVGRPLIADGRLWFNSVTGEIYGFDAASGQELLHLITGHTARVGGALFENLYIMGDPDGVLYAYVIE
jgi:outer membrane protein assembly factor BamB